MDTFCIPNCTQTILNDHTLTDTIHANQKYIRNPLDTKAGSQCIKGFHCISQQLQLSSMILFFRLVASSPENTTLHDEHNNNSKSDNLKFHRHLYMLHSVCMFLYYITCEQLQSLHMLAWKQPPEGKPAYR